MQPEDTAAGVGTCRDRQLALLDARRNPASRFAALPLDLINYMLLPMLKPRLGLLRICTCGDPEVPWWHRTAFVARLPDVYVVHAWLDPYDGTHTLSTKGYSDIICWDELLDGFCDVPRSQLAVFVMSDMSPPSRLFYDGYIDTERQVWRHRQQQTWLPDRPLPLLPWSDAEWNRQREASDARWAARMCAARRWAAVFRGTESALLPMAASVVEGGEEGAKPPGPGGAL